MVTEGTCTVQSGAESVELKAGDAVWMPLGHAHRLSMGEAELCSADVLFRAGNLPGLWEVDHGGGGARTRLVCGWIECSEFLFRPMFRDLPRLIVEHLDDDPVGGVMATTLRQILALRSEARPGAELVIGGMMETLFIEILRRRALALGTAVSGWFAALRDPLVARTIRALHDDPGRRWTVGDLAREVGTSRTVLAERFQAAMGRPPIAYITSWRIQRAADRLRDTGASISAVALEAGYESEAAFARAFKRVTGVTPGTWRSGSRDHHPPGLGPAEAA